MEKKDIVTEHYGEYAAALHKARVKSTCPLFPPPPSLLSSPSLPLLGTGRQKSQCLKPWHLELMEPEKVVALLGHSILAAHPDGTYKFHSCHVDSFIAGEVAAAARNNICKEPRELEVNFCLLTFSAILFWIDLLRVGPLA